MNGLVKSSFYNLRHLSKLKSFLNRCDLEMVLHAFITSRLDYCNSLLISVCQGPLSNLHEVQNAAACFLTVTMKFEHIPLLLALLHWLPIKFKIGFKVLLLAFKLLNGLAPVYLSDLIQPNDHLLLLLPKSRLKLREDCAFSVVGPELWNVLPLHIGLPQ